MGADLATWAALAAAVFAAWQLRQNALQTRRATTMELIRRVLDANDRASGIHIGPAQNALVRCHHERMPLTEEAQVYQQLLHALDVLGFAARKKMASLTISKEYFATLLDGDTISPGFLRELADACGVEANQDLVWLIGTSPTLLQKWLER